MIFIPKNNFTLPSWGSPLFLPLGERELPKRSQTLINFILIGLMLLSGVNPATARIGESVEILRGRYGAGKEIGNQIVFTVDRFDVTVYFENQRSVMEIYTNHPDVNGVSHPLVESDIQDLLKLQGEEKTWGKLVSGFEDSTWCRADGKIFASFLKAHNTVTFREAEGGSKIPGRDKRSKTR